MRSGFRWRAGGVASAVLMLASASVLSVQSTADEQKDVRTAIALSAADSEHMKGGMRTYLESIQGIIEGMATSKMPLVATHARMSGAKLMQRAPLTAILGLPPDFALQAAATHQKFDELAEKAEKGASKIEVLNGLGEILAMCTSCHASYRIAVK